LELIVMLLKQLAASGHAQATALYSKVSARHGDHDVETRQVGFLIVPEVLTAEEWVARYSPKDDPPGGADEVG
jgi:hypothetical protein